MKIGIVTFHHASNYGAVLQAFALKTFLRQQGHETFFVDHTFARPRGLRRFLGRTPSATLGCWAGYRRSLIFERFCSTYLVDADVLKPANLDFAKNAPHADAYICGSDQVWNPEYLQRPGCYEDLFFLNFGSANVRRIAYAASICVESLPLDWSKRFAGHLKRFNFIGVREEKAVHLLAPLTDKHVAWVPDPTLLLDPAVYREILGVDSESRDNIFSYTLDKNVSPLIAKTRKTVSETLGLAVLESYNRNPWDVLMRGVLSPSEWLSELATSRFVLTNSFHGTVFAILFRRPFIVLPIYGAHSGMNTRIRSLLGRIGLGHRFLIGFDAEKIASLCHTPIDWANAEPLLHNFSSVGASFLEKALKA